MSGDVNPAHVDEEYARSDIFRKVIAHGMWGGTLISSPPGHQAAGTGDHLPRARSCDFAGRSASGDTITVTVAAREKDEERHRITFDCTARTSCGEVVIRAPPWSLLPPRR